MNTTPNQVVAHMMQQDLFSQWLGIEVLEVKEGYSKIKMTVRKEMINGFGIVHGGIAFSLSDSAFAEVFIVILLIEINGSNITLNKKCVIKGKKKYKIIVTLSNLCV